MSLIPSATYGLNLAPVTADGLPAEIQKAIQCFQDKDYDGAIKILEALVRQYPQSAKAHEILAAAYQNSGRTDQAIREFEKLAKLQPKKAEHYHNLGLLHRSRNNYRQAALNFERALELSPGNPAYKAQLSSVYYSLALEVFTTSRVSAQSWGQIIELAQKSILYDPANADSHELLAQVYGEIAEAWKDRGDQKQADQYYAKKSAELKIIAGLRRK